MGITGWPTVRTERDQGLTPGEHHSAVGVDAAECEEDSTTKTYCHTVTVLSYQPGLAQPNVFIDGQQLLHSLSSAG